MLLKIPILNPESYEISKIYPIPNEEKIALLPPGDYYLEGTTFNDWTNDCQPNSRLYICKKSHLARCQLHKLETCETIFIEESNAYKTTSHGLLTSFSHPKEIIENCQNNVQRFTLLHNNLINSNCSIIIDNDIINTNPNFYQFPKISFNFIDLPVPKTRIHLEASHLDEVKNLKMELQELEDPSLQPLIQITHSTIIIIICIILIILFVSICIFRHRLKTALCIKRIPVEVTLPELEAMKEEPPVPSSRTTSN